MLYFFIYGLQKEIEIIKMNRDNGSTLASRGARGSASRLDLKYL